MVKNPGIFGSNYKQETTQRQSGNKPPSTSNHDIQVVFIDEPAVRAALSWEKATNAQESGNCNTQ